MAEKIGILGGSFNPPHLGHLGMARTALEVRGLDRVLFIPAAVPPHKTNHGAMASAEQRLAMTRLAVEGEARFEICDDEIRRGGISYTVDTLRRLHAAHPGAAFFLIVGADTLRELPTWRAIETILGLCTVLTIARPNYESAAMRPVLPAPWPEKLLSNVVVGKPLDISSSDVRARISRGESIAHLVPAAVARYIAAEKIYKA